MHQCKAAFTSPMKAARLGRTFAGLAKVSLAPFRCRRDRGNARIDDPATAAAAAEATPLWRGAPFGRDAVHF